MAGYNLFKKRKPFPETILGMNAIFCEMDAKNKRVQYRWLSSKECYIYIYLDRWTFSYTYIYIYVCILEYHWDSGNMR